MLIVKPVSLSGGPGWKSQGLLEVFPDARVMDLGLFIARESREVLPERRDLERKIGEPGVEQLTAKK